MVLNIFAGVIEACAQRGDTESALDILQMMRGAARDSNANGNGNEKVGSKMDVSGSGGGRVCPRPSYRSYLAALNVCARAVSPALAHGRMKGEHGVSGKGLVPEAAAPDMPGPGDRAADEAAAVGDVRASKKVLAMMWEDDAARVAEGNAAVPGTGVWDALQLL